MDLHLTFANGKISGEGNDNIGQFVIKGNYDAKNAECTWTKTYVGRHDVYYRGFREGKGIWGTWEVSSAPNGHGGFFIWPKTSPEGEGVQTTAIAKRPVEPLKINAPKRKNLAPKRS